MKVGVPKHNKKVKKGCNPKNSRKVHDIQIKDHDKKRFHGSTNKLLTLKI